MLVLSRKPKEKIVFPTLGVTLEVCSVKGNIVRVGIDAPPSVPIMREEIAEINAVRIRPPSAAQSLASLQALPSILPSGNCKQAWTGMPRKPSTAACAISPRWIRN